MADIEQAGLGNRLLRALAPEDLAALLSACRLEAMALKRVLISANTTIEVIYFVEVGIVSVTSDAPSGRVEISLLGREAAVGALPILLEDDRSPHTYFVQMAGRMVSIDVAALRGIMAVRPAIHRILCRYAQAQHIQTAQTAFANAKGTTTMRLARWLLMCQDRSDGDEITVTQEFMSLMLGVERPGVTIALQTLQKDGLVAKRRGRVQIVNRDGLRDLAGDTYGIPETEYARLIEETPDLEL